MEDGEDEILATIDNSAAALTWHRVREEVAKDPESQELLHWIRNGACDEDLTERLTPYRRHRLDLRELDGVPMLSERTIVPEKLRQEVLNTLHSAHQGVNSMMLRASDTVYWLSFKADIERVREHCLTCTAIAPSQPHLPPVDPEIPLYPFQHVCMDHFALNGKTYGVVVDRFTNWPCIYVGDASVDVCKTLAKLSEDYGIPEIVSTDGARHYTSDTVKQFMKQYGIKHRASSVANAHSNCRAEVAVKTMKRLIRDNVTLSGNLDTAKLSRALLQYRNTRDRDIGKSPAEMLMNRQLRDFMPKHRTQLIGPVWERLARQREEALAVRGAKLKERLQQQTKSLLSLVTGERVVIQNQTGNYPRRWDKIGTILEPKGFDQYRVITDGSRRITLRNIRFLRKIVTPEERARTQIPILDDVTEERGIGDDTT